MRGLIIGTLILAFQILGEAAVIHVPTEHASIQQGIDAAANGDTVLVAPGTYVENIDFLGKAISVVGSEGAEVTVIDGGQPVDPDLGSVVTFANNEGANSRLEGFTLINGSGTELGSAYIYRYGGGILCSNSSPVIRNNIIKWNKANYGGGIASMYISSPKIINNVIKRNSTQTSFHYYNSGGGGIYCNSEGSPTIRGNEITHNITTPQGLCHGGGIHLNGVASGTISENVIKHNIAGGDGGGIYSTGSSMVMSYNFVAWNEAGWEGGGIACNNGSSPVIKNNKISNNKAILYGGGIHWGIFVDLSLRNNTISLNSAKAGGGISCSTYTNQRFSNNIFRGNVAANTGGAVYYTGYGNMLKSENNTLVANAALKGGAIFCTSAGSFTLVNSILWNNNADFGKEVYMDYLFEPATLTVDYSDVEDGLESIHVVSGNTLDWGIHNIDADPLFVDDGYNDFHLLAQSPCKDTGNNAAVTDQLDYEKDPRIAGGVVDMGADERHDHFYCTGNPIPGGGVRGNIIGEPMSGPTALIIGIDVLDPPSQHAWGDLYLDSPLMVVPLGNIPANGVLMIEEYIPPASLAPYSVPMQALIGWKLSNLFVLEIKQP